MAVADTERVVVHLHLGQSVVKVWRFDPRRLQDYTRSKVEQELIIFLYHQLFAFALSVYHHLNRKKN